MCKNYKKKKQNGHSSRLCFLLIFAILSLFFCSCRQESNYYQQSANQNETQTIYPDAELEFTMAKTVFMGDSNIAHLVNYGLVEKEYVLTGSKYYMTLEPDVCRKYVVCHKAGKEMTPAEAISYLSPELLIITIGTDGTLSIDRDGFRLAYGELIESLLQSSPQTKIALQSIFPVRTGTVNTKFLNVEFTNQKFKAANGWLIELASEYGLFYLDTASVLTDSDGNLKEEYNTDHLDGYHLNREGLSCMLEYIQRSLSICDGSES